MATFDIINAAGNSYNSLWQERHYLMRLALVPIVVKFICFIIIFTLNIEENHFQSALILIPSYFVEGWMLSHWVRWIALGQKWPFMPKGDEAEDLKELNDRARGVLSGTIMYVLLQMIISAIWAASTMMPLTEETTANPPPSLQLLSVIGIVFILWSFRYLWIFLPAAVNYSLWQYVKDTGYPFLSLRMLAVWLVCCVPGFVIMMSFTLPVLLSENPDIPAVMQFFAAGLHVTLEVILNLLAVGGIAYGLKDMYARKSKGVQ